ncbi:heme ABC transporter ATP-binding protein [Bacillus xiapuensis]|uniref:heme ABC transporter ATP-binding protein n=1 Tax=Bacillus xiapuensis TaxID=2014075 RepID=UPI001E3DE5D6|nr:heme ABC transporter ATP-binding protein [Bacillus xiapuensis]
MKLSVKEITCSASGRNIIEDVTLTVDKGQFVGVVGPNGSGKSTLLKCSSRLLKPKNGAVWLNEKPLYEMTVKQTAKQLSLVQQENALSFEFSVEEMVGMGRYPHKKHFQSETAEDRQIIKEALKRTGLSGYEERSYFHLSGGEKQRVLIARALAQQAELILLDEPTNHLDIHHQLQLLQLVKKLKLTALAALHDLNLAAYFCDYLYVMKGGRIAAEGFPEKVLTADLLNEVFAVEAEVVLHPRTKKPHITFISPM